LLDERLERFDELWKERGVGLTCVCHLLRGLDSETVKRKPAGTLRAMPASVRTVGIR
jgi:hypothetical protein